MKKVLILLGIVALIGSCCPCRNLESYSDTTRIFESDTVFETDSILYHLDADTVFDSIMVQINTDNKGVQTVSSDTITASSNYADAMAWVKESELFLNVTDKDTSIMLVIDSMRQIIREKESILIKQTEVIEQKERLIDRLKHNIRLMIIGAGIFAVIFFILIPLFKPKMPIFKKWIKSLLKKFYI